MFCGFDVLFLFIEKPSPDFSGEGQLSTKELCYFLQQQHSLPLQLFSFGGVCAVAVPIKAASPRINKRYFISSPVEFRCDLGDVIRITRRAFAI